MCCLCMGKCSVVGLFEELIIDSMFEELFFMLEEYVCKVELMVIGLLFW